jgi:hypothetical protein
VSGGVEDLAQPKEAEMEEELVAVLPLKPAKARQNRFIK